jgi:hypothetical protein
VKSEKRKMKNLILYVYFSLIICIFAAKLLFNMMKKMLYFAITAVLMAACGSKQQKDDNVPNDAISIYQSTPGDSALYGLACDGCTDSILVFLPYSGGDPDTFDIINCRQQRRLLGRPHIGDALAVIVNPENRDEALCVINIGTLIGQWCYMVKPTIPTRGGNMPPIPDSILKKILVPVEYSLKLKADYTASMMGNIRNMGKNGTPSMVVYPDVHHYTDWYPFNGRLILHADTIAGFSKDGDKPLTDTAEIVLLMRDSLILRIGDKEQSFYRKKETNKL